MTEEQAQSEEDIRAEEWSRRVGAALGTLPFIALLAVIAAYIYKSLKGWW
jgi:hypothetical protein